MIGRISTVRQYPDSYKALRVLSTVVREGAVDAGLDPLLVELVKIRISQLNGCTLCLHMHSRKALKMGETRERIAALPTWREADNFGESERAALHLAESITNISPGRINDQDYAAACLSLTEDQISAVSWLAAVMNALNRVALTSRYSLRDSK
jgi:AhpD family alkylhydroperoxidase